MTAPEDLTADQRQRIDRHIHDLDREIDEKCTEQREIAGHALAVIAQAAHPGVRFVHVHDIRQDGRFGRIACEVDGNREDVPVCPQITSVLTAMLRRLPDGTTGVWHLDSRSATLDVTAALDLGDRYPFLPVQDRLLAYLEQQTGRTIRRIEIGTELWDNGYFYDDNAEVDFSDGDSENVYLEDLNDFADELREQIGGPGPHTTVVIERISTGITIE